MLPDNLKLDSIYLTAAFVAIVLAVFVLKKDGRSRKYHVVAGTVLHQLFNFHRLHDYMTDLSAKHKTYRLLSLGRNEIYTTDPINVEYILKTNFPNYGKGEHQHTMLKDLLGDGIFTVDGEKWKKQRKTASYQFSTRILRDFSSSVFKSTAVKLVAMVSDASISNQMLEIQDLFFKSTLDSVFKVILGVELDTLRGTYEDGTKFSNAFNDASEITTLRYVDIFWKIKRFMHIGLEASMGKNIKVVDEFVYKVIKSKTEQVMKSPDGSAGKDLLSRFLDLEETDPKFLKDIILSFIIAGKDTTATTMSWFLYTLCKYPHVQDRIVEETKEATNLESFSSVEELADSITEEALENMQYLTAALTETLRLYPAVPWDGKICFSDDTLPDGFSVKKGDFVSYLPYAMGRMKYVWGDDAEEFKPERWLDTNGKFQQESPFKFTAFQAGPRQCLGKDFSYRQMKIFSAILLSSHKFKLADESKKAHYRTTLTLHMDGGLHLHAHPRLGHLKP
ncbi:cytochrome P450 704C1-like [Prosopis cineraria]|uniref:cytochrome P450 704C1-like n=1 Tax=Prosopis cineraria TaxID=364024 RepID=UPI00240FD6D8|nr:cytochrome P450 704C1-like [Prosopis cineraria]